MGTSQENSIEMKWGKLSLKNLKFELGKGVSSSKVKILIDGKLTAFTYEVNENQIEIIFSNPVLLKKGNILKAIID
jgi:non-lysosomal glucosylceramidase